MIIKIRNSGGSFMELKTDEQITNCFTKEEATDVLYHLLDIVDEVKRFIEEK